MESFTCPFCLCKDCNCENYFGEFNLDRSSMDDGQYLVHVEGHGFSVMSIRGGEAFVDDSDMRLSGFAGKAIAWRLG